MKKLHLLLMFTVVTVSADAQKKTEYYANGKKSFEGAYAATVWSSFDARDFFTADTADRKNNPRSMQSISAMRGQSEVPEKIFQGECTFYYDNGQVSYTGNYENGIKNGKFTYYYYNGTKESERSYINGMATGTWKTWDKSSKLQSEQSYKGLPADILDTLYVAKHHEMGRNDAISKAREVKLANDSLRSLYSLMQTFRQKEDKQVKNTIWDGDFTYFHANGNKSHEMHYAANKRTGTWKAWDDDNKLTVEVSFKDGMLSGGKNYKSPAGDAATGIDPGMVSPASMHNPPGATIKPNAPQVFSYVEQMPESSVDVNTYLSKNLVYPKAARDNGVQGRVIVKFVVNEDGTTSDVQAIRGIGAGCDDEAIRVVKNMPPWKPGKQNGKAVKVYYTLPVSFVLQEEPKK